MKFKITYSLEDAPVVLRFAFCVDYYMFVRFSVMSVFVCVFLLYFCHVVLSSSDIF